jgi:hypothetical protein
MKRVSSLTAALAAGAAATTGLIVGAFGWVSWAQTKPADTTGSSDPTVTTPAAPDPGPGGSGSGGYDPTAPSSTAGSSDAGSASAGDSGASGDASQQVSPSPQETPSTRVITPPSTLPTRSRRRSQATSGAS